MPIYEFQCVDCKRKFSALVGVVANSRQPSCPTCSSINLVKVVSRFSRVRSEEDALDSLADESNFDEISTDPKAMRRFVHEMGSALDDDQMDGDFEETLEEEFTKKSSRVMKSDNTVH